MTTGLLDVQQQQARLCFGNINLKGTPFNMARIPTKKHYSRHSVNGPSVTGNVQLTNIYLSGNRMARLCDYHSVTGLKVR